MGLFDRLKSGTAPTQKGLTSEEWCDKGLALHNSGRYQEEIPCYDMAVARNPQNASAWASKGIALIHLGRYQEALPCINNALAIDPWAGGWLLKGGLLRTLGRPARSAPVRR
jgi:tetratricopeptide (TPR) repeat protein